MWDQEVLDIEDLVARPSLFFLSELEQHMMLNQFVEGILQLSHGIIGTFVRQEATVAPDRGQQDVVRGRIGRVDVVV
jgi:hypothetical protein